MNRSLKLSALVALALASSQAMALDLGQIQVKSALDRPLVAEIPLHPDYPGEADQVQVSLAPASAFAQAGISRANLKVPLSFAVVTHADGQKFIRVTSTQPVREPYLDFLIQVTWPKGKMLREYTVLLDPLSASPSFQTSTTATTSNTAQPAAAPEPAPAPAPGEPSAPAPATPSRDVYGPVPHGDTLSHIARANAIDGVSYQQMLVALKAANPDAFFQDNVNALKAGAVLRIPTRQEALSVTRKAAIAAVRRQNQSWQAEHAPAPTMVASSGGSPEPVTSAGAGAGGDHLTLVPPEAKGGASAGAAGGGDASASQLRQELARSQEALSSQKQSAADLASRVKALEQLQDKNKRLLSLKNAEIAALQEKLGEAREDAGLPALPASSMQAGMAGTASVAANAMPVAAASVAGTMPMAAASTPGKSSSATVAGTAAATAPAGATEPAAEPRSAAAQDNAGATTTQARGSASVPWYAQLWVRIALAVIIVLLIVWALLRRRKPKDKQGRRSLADHFGDSPIDGAAGAAAVAMDDEDAGENLAQPVADDDGEQELLAQLGEHPDNVGLHLELASLYYARRDVDHFESAAEAMHAYVDDEDQPEWQEVQAMGRELAPDHPLFAVAPAADETFDDTLEGMPGEPEPRMADEGMEHGGGSQEYDFDFDPVPETDADGNESPEPESRTGDIPDGMPDESEFDALPPLPSEADDLSTPEQAAQAGGPLPESGADDLSDALSTGDPADEFAREGFSDDPVDTKLDLARAYIDMGDHEGARAMLQEAVSEGSQMQKDAARKLLDELD